VTFQVFGIVGREDVQIDHVENALLAKPSAAPAVF
jgi:hypothetical protein